MSDETSVRRVRRNAERRSLWSSLSSRELATGRFPAFERIPAAATAHGTHIGGFFGPKMVGNLSQSTGSFSRGFVFMIACWTIASLLVLLCPREKASQ